MTPPNEAAERAAEKHATHSIDCTCKGKTVEPVKQHSFLAGNSWTLAHDPRVLALVEALKQIAETKNRSGVPSEGASIARAALAQFEKERMG